MARRVTQEPAIIVDYEGVATITVYFEDVPHGDHWLQLLDDEGVPPGGSQPAWPGPSRGEVTISVDVAHAGKAMDWLATAVERAAGKWKHDEDRREAARDEVESVVLSWWDDRRRGLQ